MALWIQILPGVSEPIYSQIVSQISQAIAKGVLSTGDKLPPVRALAAELVINPNTAARAYTILEQQGLVSSKTGSGTFVTDPKNRTTDGADINILTDRIDTIITRGLNLGLTGNDLVKLFSDRLNRFLDKERK